MRNMPLLLQMRSTGLPIETMIQFSGIFHIKENKDLDLPAHKVIVATVRYEEIANEKHASFFANEEWCQLEEAVQSGPIPGFGRKINSLLDTYLSIYYRSLPPVSKTYGVACLMTTAAYYLQLYDVDNIALIYGLVFKRLQVWRLITNLFFLGPFSFPFAIRLIMIAKYGVSLERGPFDKRTADYVWMFIFGALSLLVMAAVPYLWSPFMGISLVFMIVYVWSREFPNARINIYGVVSLKGFYLPWALLALDLIFGNPLKPDILGMLAGHLYYFLTVLHPLAGGKFKFNTPLWVHKIVAYWGEGTQINAPVQSSASAGIVFRGRSHRLGGTQTTTRSTEQETTDQGNAASPQPQNQGDGIAFRGRSYRLNG